jgi:dihydropteroate synthase
VQVANEIIFRGRRFAFAFPRPAVIMGIVNVTPDSFSDGGKFFDPQAAVARGQKLAAEGAEILDVGGESTRPGAAPVSEPEELRRVIPVIEQLAAGTRAVLSIDTMKPAVARAALAAGAAIVNDVAAARSGPEMWRAVTEAGAGYVAMHSQGEPRTMQQHPVYADVVREVAAFFSERLATLAAAGVPAEQVVLDPGIGFGKTPEHNLQLLGGLRSFTKWRRPLLLGVSRKSLLAAITGARPAERLPASLACAILAVQSGVNLIRVHDVAQTVQAVRMAEAILQNTNADRL